MKCIAKTSRWGVKPCPNNAKCDGYCYAHHPSVVLAKLVLEQRFRARFADASDLNGRIQALRDTVDAITPSVNEQGVVRLIVTHEPGEPT